MSPDRDHPHEVAGTVRVGSPAPFTRVWLRPRLAKLLREHANLSVTVTFGAPGRLEASLVKGDLDLIVLTRAAEEPNLDAEAIFTEHFRAYAAPSYLHEHGVPTTRDELAAHRFIVYDDDLPMHGPWWRGSFGTQAPLPTRIACKVASLYEMRALAAEGVGIAVLPDYFAEPLVDKGMLTRLRHVSDSRVAAVRNDVFLVWRRGALGSACFVTVRDALRV